MKKFGSVVLMVALALSLAGFAGAAAPTTWAFEEAGITLDVPEGLTSEDISEDESYLALELTDPNEPNVAYYYSVGYEESMAGLWTQDLTQEDLETVLVYLVGEETSYTYDQAEANGVHYTILASEGQDEMHFIAILNGWVCSVTGIVADGYTLGDAAIEDMGKIIEGVTYAEAE